MIKQLKKNGKKGFTLVELIVTIAIFSILGIGAMALLIETANTFAATARLNSVQTATLMLVSEIRTDASAAERVDVLTSVPTKEDRITYSGTHPGEHTGYLYFENDNLYKIYDGAENPFRIAIDGVGIKGANKFLVKFINRGNDVLELEVKVVDKNDETDIIYEYSTNLRVHNTEAPTVAVDDPPITDTIGGDAEGTCVRFKMPE